MIRDSSPLCGVGNVSMAEKESNTSSISLAKVLAVVVVVVVQLCKNFAASVEDRFGNKKSPQEHFLSFFFLTTT